MSKRYRDAIAGKIVSADHAAANPETTVSETIEPSVAAFNALFKKHDLAFGAQSKTMDEVLNTVDIILNSHRVNFLQVKLIRDILDAPK